MELDQLTLFTEDTLASLSVTPGSDEARKMTATSGQKYAEYLPKSDPVGLLGRMLLGTSVWGSTRCLLTWKASTTPRKRLLYRLRPSVPRIEETECSLWPTPDTNNHRDGTKLRTDTNIQNGGKHGVSLHHAMAFWPTPNLPNGGRTLHHVDEWRGKIPYHNGQKVQVDLQNAVRLWPTPHANCHTGSGKNGEGGANLQTAIQEGQTGQLNPEWVEILMNFPPGWTEV